MAVCHQEVTPLPRHRIRRADSYALSIGCHDGSSLKLRAISTEDSRTNGTLEMRAKIHEPDDSAVWMLMNDRQFTEVLVQRDQHLTMCGGGLENTLVSGIRGPASDPLDLVSR